MGMAHVRHIREIMLVCNDCGENFFRFTRRKKKVKVICDKCKYAKGLRYRKAYYERMKGIE